MFLFYNNVPHFDVVKSTNHENKFNFEQLPNIDEIKIKGKTIIILCGNDTKEKFKAARYSKYIFDWLKDNPNANKMDMFSIFYQNGQPLFSDLEVNPEFNYDVLAKTLFEPLIRNKNRVFSTKEVSDNFGQILFFGHSVGGLVIDELMNSLQTMLNNYNFSDDDIKNILSNVVFVGYSPFKMTTAPIKTIFVTPLFDSVGSAKKAVQFFAKNSETKTSVSKLNLKEISNHSEDIYYEQFIDYFRNKMHQKPSIVLKNENSIDIISDLLYYDGTKEDHNLAGIIDYRAKNPYKTKAGDELTKFMSNLFNYCLETNRKDLDLNNIYSMATNPAESYQPNTKE